MAEIIEQNSVKQENSAGVTFQDQLNGGGNLEKSKSDSKLNQVSASYFY